MATNDGFEYRERIGREADGERLESYLARRYPHTSLSGWRSRIRSGQVLLDSCRVRPETPICRGQTLVWERPAWNEPDAPLSFAVLFEDETLLGVAKPAGLPTLPGGGFLNSTLLHRVRRYAPDATPLHRLGRWTSGVVLFARTRAARANLTEQFATRRVLKRYRALAVGSPSRGSFEIHEPIGPVPHVLLGSVHAVSTTGREATSRVEILEYHRDAFLCDVRIETGRPHQIRIHLAAAGHPLVGDPLYGAGGKPAPECRALPGDPGYQLHASELSFQHPDSERRVTISCIPPPNLRRRSHPW